MKLRMLSASMLCLCLLAACDDALEFSVYEHDGNFCEPECAEGKVCVGGECIDDPSACRDGQVKCDGKQPRICSGFRWVNRGNACSGAQVCSQGKCTLEGAYCGDFSVLTCLNNDNQIGIIYQCSKQKWKETQGCVNGVSCTGYGNSETLDNLCGVCRDGDSRCEEDNGATFFVVCNKGKWQTMNRCDDHCNEKTGC